MEQSKRVLIVEDDPHIAELLRMHLHDEGYQCRAAHEVWHTVETATHRTFQFLDASLAPDNKLVVSALDDAFFHGVLSSRFHAAWALARGALLEDRPVYPKTECF